MAKDTNTCIFIGHLAAKPETSFISDGTPMMKFRLAVNRLGRDSHTGESAEVASFLPIALIGKRAESLSQYMDKGSQVAVVAEARQSSWKDREGNQRSSIEFFASDIQLLGGRKDSSAVRNQEPRPSKPKTAYDPAPVTEEEEELPF